MGNRCCRPESSSVVWAGDGWEAQSSETEKPSIASSSPSIGSSSSTQSHRQVKIVMTRKELEELLRKADVHGVVSARDVMMDSSGRKSVDHQYPSWRPAFASIPEIN